MPIIPTVPEDVGAIQAPRVRVDAQAFGVGIGRSLEQLGNTLSQSGDKIFARAQALQQEQNEDEKTRLETDWIMQSANIKEEYESLEGLNKVNAFKDYQGKLATLKDKISGQASNPWVKDKMNNFLLRNMAYSVSHAAGQAAAAQRQATTATNEAKLGALDAQLHGSAGSDMNMFDDIMEQKKIAIYNIAGAKGIGTEVAEQTYQRELEKSKYIWANAIKESDPYAAKELIDNTWKGQFGIYTDKIIGAVDDKIDRVMGRNEAEPIVAQVIADKGTFEDVQEKLKERAEAAGWDQKTKWAVSDAAKRAWGIGKQIQHEKYVGDRDLIVNALTPGPGEQGPTSIEELQIDPKVRQAIDDQPQMRKDIDKALLQNITRGIMPTPAVERNMLNWQGLALGSAEEKAELLSLEPLKMDDLPNHYKKQLMMLQQKVRGGGYTSSRVNSALTSLINQGYFPSGMDKETTAVARAQLSNAVEYFREQHKGAWPNQDELKGIARDLTFGETKSNWYEMLPTVKWGMLMLGRMPGTKTEWWREGGILEQSDIDQFIADNAKDGIYYSQAEARFNLFKMRYEKLQDTLKAAKQKPGVPNAVVGE